MKKWKRAVGVLTSVVLTAAMGMTSFGWDTNRFLYEPTVDANGYVTGWNWEDQDLDGVFECYYSNAEFFNSCDEEYKLAAHTWNRYTDVNKYIRTTPDGYQVNVRSQWVVDGVVQTKTREIAVAPLLDIPYDPAHPLARVVDKWNLRLPSDTLGGWNVCDESLQALLTGQMDYHATLDIANYATLQDGMYVATRNGNTIYVTKEDYDEGYRMEKELYEWFCNWLNGMDFENMTEMERAKEIQKVMAKVKYDVETTGSTRYAYYRTLIEQQGMCGECAVTACSLAKALGLKAAVSGTANHDVYYIQVDGVVYFGQNDMLNLNAPTPDTIICH